MESIITALLSPLKNFVAWIYHVLAFIHLKRFKKSGKREDLEKSIMHNRTALSFRPREGRGRSVSLLNLALCLWERHNRWGQSEDLEKAIELGRTALGLRPRDHQSRLKYLYNLSTSLETRFKQHGRTEDLDEAIELLRAALKLRRKDHLDRSASLTNLACYLQIRYDQYGRTEDLEEAIELCRSALNLQPEGYPHRSISLNNLAKSLTTRYEQHGSSEDLEEAIELGRAALLLRSEGYLDRSAPLLNLARSLWTRYEQHGRTEDLEEAINLDREALKLSPLGHPDRPLSLNNLAGNLTSRYYQHGRTEDLENAIEMHRAAVALQPEGHPDRSAFLTNFANSLTTRYQKHGRAEDLKEAVEIHRAALKHCGKGHPNRPKYLMNLSCSLQDRYHQHGVTKFLEEAIELYREALELCPKGHTSRYISLNNLAGSLWTRYERHRRTEDLEEALALNRSALELCPKGHPSHSLSLYWLAVSLTARYKEHGRIEDIEGAIKVHRAALKLRPEGHPDRSRSLRSLADSLHARVEKHWHTKEFEECMRSLEFAATDKFSGLSERLVAARQWVKLARLHDHSTVFAAYKAVISILQNALTINPTLHAQHDFLLKNSDYTTLSLDAASYAVKKNQLEQAVEILEQGRGLLWSQLRGLRSPLDQLAKTNNELADRFKNVTHRLEKLATSHEPPTSASTIELSSEQEEVISEIRRIPGFESFLEATSFKVLQQAAVEGPVIMVNHSKVRSDALIILSRDDPSVICVPLDNEFHLDSLGLSQELVVTREWLNADSSHYDQKLRKAMKMLWDRVVSKVVVGLEKVGITKGSRIWWCPTSELSALPFHAAGPFEDASGTMKYLLDDYISSYTPTLGALVNARSGGYKDDPTVLAIGDTSLRSTKQEISNIRNCGMSTKLLIDKKASHDRVIKALREATWVHFACHGHLGSTPFNSSFNLSDRHLTMLDIVQNRLPNAEFAFLSACHTAEQHHDSAYDETLHLAAAMQFSGFRSVIGSMWELLDKDGPGLTKSVYEHINDCEVDEAKYKRAAGGLRKAALELKARDGIQAERWVNLVHIGA
ncbi:uncharacterized protein FOMMEDRAFT_82442 [Fomitiporia mediterranea MF3/22]|uniref:uncharacterized protein n=1 Tax=Fomitiporia mediterranea (strain MF3/22) TaxID=694068 RepID=UPI0004408BDF|nr:uncharacterized protein FOMMEDRAFT_82442 [Fomitiporia mediterranea MF3/22]EJD04657.1 hypothetical protein FOMMEDRAFT_82442 [Fomitiporia mediterranea MF3/22]